MVYHIINKQNFVKFTVHGATQFYFLFQMLTVLKIWTSTGIRYRWQLILGSSWLSLTSERWRLYVVTSNIMEVFYLIYCAWFITLTLEFSFQTYKVRGTIGFGLNALYTFYISWFICFKSIMNVEKLVMNLCIILFLLCSKKS